ncbi:MAG: NfeD family protein [Solirubrobacterales bacterium]
MADWIYWIIAAVILAGIELAVFSVFFFGPLSLAAIVAAVVAALGGSVELQMAVFVLLGVASMFALRPVAEKYRHGDPELVSNVDALIGKEAFVLEELTHDKLGLVRFESDNWTAKPIDSIASIPANEHVRVVKVAGATVVVEPLTTNPSEGADA